jgi:RNA polymerase sigma-70 factor, ECF subfamily
MAAKVSEWPESPGLRSENRIILTRLFEQHRKKLVRVAMRITHNQDDAEDVVQEAALRALLKLQSFRGESRLETWIYTIVANCALSRLRSPVRRRSISLDSELNADENSPRWIALDAGKTPEGNCLACELEEIVLAEIELLKAPYPSVLKLCDLEGWTCLEAAEILEVNEHTLEAQLYRGRRKLRTRVLTRLFGSVHPLLQVKQFRVHTARHPRRKKPAQVKAGAEDINCQGQSGHEGRCFEA